MINCFISTLNYVNNLISLYSEYNIFCNIKYGHFLKVNSNVRNNIEIFIQLKFQVTLVIYFTLKHITYLVKDLDPNFFLQNHNDLNFNSRTFTSLSWVHKKMTPSWPLYETLIKKMSKKLNTEPHISKISITPDQ